MTIEELLKACANGRMPKVKTSNPIKYSKSEIGQVVRIANYKFGFKGCSVEYPGLNQTITYLEGETHQHKMNELSLIE